MKVTNVTFYRMNSGKLKAFADVEIDGEAIIKGFRVFEGSNGLFACVPSEKSADGEWRPRVRWVDEKYYKKGGGTPPLLEAVVDAYQKENEKKKSGAGRSASSSQSEEGGDDPW